MSDMENSPASNPARGSGWVLAGMGALLLVGIVFVARHRSEKAPPPAAIAHDKLLVLGHEQFLVRCANCHGMEGKGDGPLASHLLGPPPGNLTDSTWKYGDQPSQVLNVLRNGAPNSAMPPWKNTLTDEQLRAVAGYVYYLGNRDVPEVLRRPPG